MHTEKLATAALTIAGSDSCGGAGIQADLKTFAAFGIYGASVVTALTAQNTLGVRSVTATDLAMLDAQLECVLDDLPVRAIKTGMLGSAGSIDIIRAGLAARAPNVPLVMDPVMVATSGSILADEETIAAMRKLMSMATLVTPNLDEALTGIAVRDLDTMRRAAANLLESGCAGVLVKGGHLSGPAMHDLLVTPDAEKIWSHPVRPGRFHGTGCTLASAVAAGLALGGSLEYSVDRAVSFVQEAMQRGGLPASGKLVLLGHNA
jgi:hydroxymethylpyrimidine/phosphomethylpyrimidine kinase